MSLSSNKSHICESYFCLLILIAWLESQSFFYPVTFPSLPTSCGRWLPYLSLVLLGGGFLLQGSFSIPLSPSAWGEGHLSDGVFSVLFLYFRSLLTIYIWLYITKTQLNWHFVYDRHTTGINSCIKYKLFVFEPLPFGHKNKQLMFQLTSLYFHVLPVPNHKLKKKLSD